MMDAFEREARRVLRRLAAGALLKLRADGCGFLVVARGRISPQAVPAEALARMLSNGWLERGGDGFHATETGRVWLARGNEEDPFAARHRVLETRLVKDERGRECYVAVNAAESPIALLRRHGLVTAMQFEAGEKLRRDFTMAQLSPRLCVDFSAPVGRRSLKPELLIAETALAAKQRFNRAMRAAGPGLADVLFDVCCMLKGLEESERGRNWPRASGKVVLRIALDRLADHYGMTAPKRSRTRAWKMEEQG